MDGTAPHLLDQAVFNSPPVDADFDAAGIHAADIVAVVILIGADGTVTAVDLEAAAAQIILLDGQLLERPRLPLGEQRLQLLLPAGLSIAHHQLDVSLALIEDIRVSIAQILLQDVHHLPEGLLLLVVLRAQRAEQFHRTGNADHRAGGAQVSRPPVGAVDAVQLPLADGIGALDHLAAIPLQVLFCSGGNLPAAALGVHIGQGVLETVTVLVQGSLLVSLARQRHGICQVADPGAAVLHGDVHLLTAGVKRQPHGADHGGLPPVPAEVGDAVIHKLADCLGNVGEAAADGLPEVLSIRRIVQLELFFLHIDHIVHVRTSFHVLFENSCFSCRMISLIAAVTSSRNFRSSGEQSSSTDVMSGRKASFSERGIPRSSCTVTPSAAAMRVSVSRLPFFTARSKWLMYGTDREAASARASCVMPR